ncbi:hypothetical protein [Lactococcus cremoris]|uniref:Uncharacterized protein n=3 Tax=Lactococcus lactis subsp. cremoris TaxID=1359 RepID=T0S5F4_LACLC|nr:MULTISPECIES: hypothetical protein [Lactococcus]EQC56615.1 hypothetical protein LLT6_04395 [Lactococcus cremoris subsp. cremoris TIFN6]EQC57189.1 hypothetical protein LLT5_09825 [Lactococcus cremoris subsp. cremoris TIFN5]EQC84628.1 hypothetical protein LLT7_08115 [Lactococcus cremoris subsp. cremoris TIFN7]EQC86426.1 hypothetical protein LLT1_11870 [Lactococcus cremoris subsp. cremoris TIFN1]EQC94880.1 hypothetical protein LLT3_10155 [Lactococcus cremoris subsp. cremoris TIFN3]
MFLVLWLAIVVIAFLLQIYVWPRIPKSIFKYRGLVLSISLIILIFVVRIPLEITALTLPFYLMMLFGLFLFWKDRKL